MSAGGADMLPVTAVRQYFYCKREPYYIYVVHLQEPPSETMEAGKSLHSEDPFQAFLRGLRPQKMFRAPPLRSPRLRLAGTPDYVFVTRFGEVVPAEIKYTDTTRGPRGLQFIAQLVAYALILEDNYSVAEDSLVERGDDPHPTPLVVKRGAIYSPTLRRVETVEITQQLKKQVEKGIAELHALLSSGEFPQVRQPPAKCANCWYRRYCYP